MTQQPVLRRKVVRPRPQAEPAPQISDLARAIPRALVRAVSAAAGLTAVVGPVTETRLSLDEMLDRLAEDGFVALLSPASGRSGSGLAILEQPLFSGLIEAMTLGRLSPRVPDTRRPTATDTALLGAVVDQTLAELAPVLGLTADQSGAPGDMGGGSPPPPDRQSAPTGARWHMTRCVSDLRLLGAVMDEGGYRMLAAPVRLTGDGASRDGTLTFVLPSLRRPDEAGGQGAGRAPVVGAANADPAAGGPGATGQSADPFQSALEQAIMGAPVVLGSVLGRMPMTLEQAMDLRVGQRLELPLSQLEEVEVTGLDGTCQARARLGQSRGLRALRIIALNEPRPGVVMGQPMPLIRSPAGADGDPDTGQSSGPNTFLASSPRAQPASVPDDRD